MKNPMDRGAWRATAHGVTKSWIWLSNWAGTHAGLASLKMCDEEKKAGGVGGVQLEEHKEMKMIY